ncbi:hypothetical protein [Curtobacterium poinsettiae]|uniref:hypothetical protein n=1 Tax=Curtobacterium poinsettiae TaxID=159612 RepID=UPI00217ECE12|nr:hypothetical protein [Curtobacterium flaccumfaciens]MCS6578212.1 hypothetical protein [Curtobacterium flaccumfaciens]
MNEQFEQALQNYRAAVVGEDEATRKYEQAQEELERLGKKMELAHKTTAFTQRRLLEAARSVPDSGDAEQ